MNMMLVKKFTTCRGWVQTFICAALTFSALSVRADLTYQNIGEPTGTLFQYLSVAGISGGKVIGFYETSTTGSHPGKNYLFQNGTFANLNYPGSLQTGLEAISGSNVAGTYIDTSSVEHGFFYNGSSFIALNAPNAQTTTPTCISGTTIGGSYVVQGTSNSQIDGFIYSNGTFTTVSPDQVTEINGISGNLAVGDYYGDDTNLATEAFFYNISTNVVTTLSPPGADPAVGSVAYGVSGNLVVGAYFDSSANPHAFLYNIALGTYSSLGRTASSSRVYSISGNNIIGMDSEGLFFYDGTNYMTIQPPGTSTTIPVGTIPYLDGNTIACVFTLTTPANSQAIFVGTVTPPGAPAISSFSPEGGPVGTQVVIEGINFTAPVTVTFGGDVTATATGTSTQITATVPPGAQTGPIMVTAAGGNFSTLLNFNVGNANSLYFQNGTSLGILSLNSTFLPNTWQGIGTMNSGWQEQAIGDIEGTGIPAIIFQNGTLIGALIMNADGTPDSWLGIGTINAGWELRGAADIADDGNIDLIFQNGGQLGYVEVNSSGVPVSWTGIGTMTTGWQLRAVASLDGTGQPDLIFQNSTLIGALKVNTSGVPTAWSGIGAMNAGWTLSDALDVTGDGQPELIFQNGAALGALEVNISFQPVAWYGIGAMSSGWTLPGDY